MPHAKIATHQAVYTLEQLHAELGGKILDNKAEAQRLADSMKHVEAVLKLLQPGYSVRSISIRRRKPNQWFKRGTVWRSVLDVMRETDKPLTASEVATQMIVSKGMKPSVGAVRALEGAVRASLKAHSNKFVTANGSPARWSLSNLPF